MRKNIKPLVPAKITDQRVYGRHIAGRAGIRFQIQYHRIVVLVFTYRPTRKQWLRIHFKIYLECFLQNIKPVLQCKVIIQYCFLAGLRYFNLIVCFLYFNGKPYCQSHKKQKEIKCQVFVHFKDIII